MVADKVKNHWYQVVLREGRNREVRRLWEAVNCQVSRLIRTRYGDLSLPRNLRQRHAVELEPDIVKKMAMDVKLSIDDPTPKPDKKKMYKFNKGRR